MGRWSYSLDGSDAALDYKSEVVESLCELINITEDDFFDQDGFTPDQVRELNKLIDNWEPPATDDDDMASGLAIVAILMMENGLNIPKPLLQDMSEEIRDVKLYSEEEEEIEHCNELLKELKKYK